MELPRFGKRFRVVWTEHPLAQEEYVDFDTLDEARTYVWKLRRAFNVKNVWISDFDTGDTIFPGIE